MRRSLAAVPKRDIHRIASRGVTMSSLERALGLSAGYLSKVRHGAVRASEHLELLLALLARHPSLLAELGAHPRPVTARKRPAARSTRGRQALALVASLAGPLDDAGVRWAVGGATALIAHGLARETADVDLFVDDGDRSALEIFRAAGAAVGKLSSTAFIAFPPRSSAPEDHVDIVFCRSEPLKSALRRPERLTVRGVELVFVPAPELCLQKLISHSPKDATDAQALIDAGLVGPAALRAALAKLPRLGDGASPYARFHCDRALGEKRLRERSTA